MRIVVTGTGGASGYAVAVQAERLGYEVLRADADPLCPALLTRPHRARLLPPASEGAGYLEALAKAAREFGAEAVSFNTDAEVRYAAGEADALGELGLAHWIPSYETVRVCSDKAAFARRLSTDARFRTPVSFSARDLPEGLLPAPSVFVKTRTGSGGADAGICSGRPELDAWLARHPDGLIQEVLTGQEFSADCLYTGTDRPLVVARRRLRTRAGASTVTETFHAPEVEDLVADLVEELRVVGPSCVQGFLQPDGVVLTEVNVRFGGGCAAAVWGATHLVEQYLALLSSGGRRLPAGTREARGPGTTTLVRVPGFVTLRNTGPTEETRSGTHTEARAGTRTGAGAKGRAAAGDATGHAVIGTAPGRPRKGED
ncbi:ATP-grasp domain-containing protein [Streptomyces sp. NPDC058861]|uniref:ATP-grasp domain-containing protein n=1 Tax=Streptomyces sp. NPDC058861 TaxID=3346653 RepID=UPI003684EE41